MNENYLLVLVVKEQDTEDGDFPTVKSPNPEEREGLQGRTLTMGNGQVKKQCGHLRPVHKGDKLYWLQGEPT